MPAAQTVRAPRLLALGLAASMLPSAWANTPAAFRQIVVQPFGVGMFEPTLSADGMQVAFRSTADLAGQNADGSFEVFVHDRLTGTTRQATSTPGGSGTSISVPMILPDATRVVFRSLWDFNAGAPGATFQLWETNLVDGTIRQVTFNPLNTPVFNPRMSGDGNWLVFTSRINPTGQNADGSEEVFRINRVSGVIDQISSNASSQAQFPDINGDGTVVVWGDRANYDGTNANAGLEIWKWTSGVITSVTRQTTGTLETNLPRVDSAGRYVCFVSLFDFSGGAATGRKVFVADTSMNPPAVTRITSTGVGGSGADVPDAEIAPDGSRVYFESNINLVGQNADGNRELFAYDIAGATLSQVTNTTLGATIIQLSDDATRRYIEIAANGAVTYRTDQDLDPGVLNNRDNLDLFVGDCAFIDVTPAASTVLQGSNVTLSSSIRPAGTYTYQWLKDGTPIDPLSNPSAATDALSLNPASLGDSGVYQLVATSACGTVRSNLAGLTVTVPPCLGDFNADASVNILDLVFFLAQFGLPATPGSDAERADLNADGFVNTPDLVALLNVFGGVCP